MSSNDSNETKKQDNRFQPFPPDQNKGEEERQILYDRIKVYEEQLLEHNKTNPFIIPSSVPNNMTDELNNDKQEGKKDDEENKIINFYEVDKPYGYFSNYALYPIKVDGAIYSTSEHYFQAMKIEDPAYRDIVIHASTPNIARELARMKDEPNHRYEWRRKLNEKIQSGLERGVKMREDWDVVKETFMLKALRAKFTQHKVLQKNLLETKNAIIQECTHRDLYWACFEGKGQNRLGHLLMQVRQELNDTISAYRIKIQF